MKIADQVWVAVALLHQEEPEAEGFTQARIVARVRTEFVRLSPGVLPHIYAHCVANKPPSPGRYRMLYQLGRPIPGAGNLLAETATPYRARPTAWRLFRDGDDYWPEREGSKSMPDRKELPPKYHRLIDWYENEYAPQDWQFSPAHPLLALEGIGESRKRDVSTVHDRHLAAGTLGEWRR